MSTDLPTYFITKNGAQARIQVLINRPGDEPAVFSIRQFTVTGTGLEFDDDGQIYSFIGEPEHLKRAIQFFAKYRPEKKSELDLTRPHGIGKALWLGEALAGTSLEKLESKLTPEQGDQIARQLLAPVDLIAPSRPEVVKGQITQMGRWLKSVL